MRRLLGVGLCLLLMGCAGKKGDEPPPPPSVGVTSSVPASSTTVSRTPNVTGEAIPGLEAGAFHGVLESSGFTKAPGASTPGFTTTTSKRADATISTYGTGPTDVVKIVAESDTAVAPAVLATVVAAVANEADTKKAVAWLKAELKKGPRSQGGPRTATATYAKVPYDLLVNQATATLSIGRLTR